MIGIKLGLGIAGLAAAQGRLARYTAPDGTQPSLVLDFTTQTYGADTDASLALYASPDGTLPSLVLDFENAEYGRQ